MSELKAFDVVLGRYAEDGYPCIVAVDADQNPRELDEKVYLKSEADKVIAEKDKEIALLKERICNGDVSRLTWIDTCLDQDKEIEELKDKCQMHEYELRHQKYKRCMAMKYVEWLKQIIIGLHPESILYRKAFKRERKWKELAEKFKEAK